MREREEWGGREREGEKGRRERRRERGREGERDGYGERVCMFGG